MSSTAFQRGLAALVVAAATAKGGPVAAPESAFRVIPTLPPAKKRRQATAAVVTATLAAKEKGKKKKKKKAKVAYGHAQLFYRSRSDNQGDRTLLRIKELTKRDHKPSDCPANSSIDNINLHGIIRYDRFTITAFSIDDQETYQLGVLLYFTPERC